jgi:penicillin amidase
MKRLKAALLLAAIWGGCSRPAGDSLAQRARAALSQTEGRLRLEGLQQPVEVLRDTWGVPHIYAQSPEDLFFAQGFVAAQDRLFQMEIWRRTGAGELAELLGPSYVERDRFARLMRFRGDMAAEWASYSPDSRRIMESFARGVNAYVKSAGDHLPIEFQLLGARPGTWKAEDCLLRLAGLLMCRNAVSEVARAQLVSRLGPELTTALLPPDPPSKLAPVQGPLMESIDSKVVQTLEEAIGPVRFDTGPGSNNWVVDGTMSATGKPLLANDPHRPVLLPSLRYMAHLVAPGWNVIGSGEPALPGIAVGHNERVAFGFTIVGIDQQDIYVEQTNPGNPNLYQYKGEWRSMQVEREKIRVKGKREPVEVELKFTVHGPVIYEDPGRGRAFALRWVGSEPGAAGYLPSLALDRVRNWQEFLGAMERWKVPSENIVYADVDGNIGWFAAGMSPIRKNWNGLLPVPGESGAYEWNGFLPASELPRAYNPPKHYIATANHNILPPGYPHQLGYEWAAPFRFGRIDEVLKSGKRFTVEDFERLQHDVTSLEARRMIALLQATPGGGNATAGARRLIETWDAAIDKNSPAAALYEIWIRKVAARFIASRVPPDVRSVVENRLSRRTMIDLIAKEPVAARSPLLQEALAEALAEGRQRLGPAMEHWRWGALHQIRFHHPLALDAERRRLFDLGPVERSGDANTVLNTGGPDFSQASGASYREIFDLADWDRSVAINVPGQSGQPASPHYSDLLPLWADGKYFPLAYSRAAVEKNTAHRLLLEPK